MSNVFKRNWNKKGNKGSCWAFNYKDAFGKRKIKSGFKTKVEAERELSKTLQEIENGFSTTINKNLLFKEISEIFIKNYAQVYLKPSTCDGYKNYLRTHIHPYMGDMKVLSISPNTLNDFIRIKKDTTKLSNQSINKVIALVKTIFTYSVDLELINRNPAKTIRKLEEYKKPSKPLTRDEVAAVLKVARKHYPDFYPLLFTAISTGMRRGELLALTWDRINFVEGYLIVDRNVYNNQFCKPKTKTSIRRIDLPLELIKTLKEWRLRCPNGELGLVFPNEEGNFQDPKNMKNRKYKQVLRRAGIDHRTFHDLRHTYATLLVSSDTNIQYVQAQLGHAKISMTMDTYAKMTQETRQRGVDSLNDVFGSSDIKEEVKRFGT